jgi:hypothetical protein
VSEEERAAAVEKAPKIDEAERTEVVTAFREVDVEPVDVDVEIDVGVAAPRTVTFHPLPPTIVEIVPDYSGYVYFITSDGTVVIVDPNAYVIVYVISV